MLIAATVFLSLFRFLSESFPGTEHTLRHMGQRLEWKPVCPWNVPGQSSLSVDVCVQTGQSLSAQKHSFQGQQQAISFLIPCLLFGGRWGSRLCRKKFCVTPAFHTPLILLPHLNSEAFISTPGKPPRVNGAITFIHRREDRGL